MHHCSMGVCSKCWGAFLLVIGALVLANWYWPTVEWPLFIGALLVLKGLLKLAMPTCGHCKEQAPAAVPKKRRK